MAQFWPGRCRTVFPCAKICNLFTGFLTIFPARPSRVLLTSILPARRMSRVHLSNPKGANDAQATARDVFCNIGLKSHRQSKGAILDFPEALKRNPGGRKSDRGKACEQAPQGSCKCGTLENEALYVSTVDERKTLDPPTELHA